QSEPLQLEELQVGEFQIVPELLGRLAGRIGSQGWSSAAGIFARRHRLPADLEKLPRFAVDSLDALGRAGEFLPGLLQLVVGGGSVPLVDGRYGPACLLEFALGRLLVLLELSNNITTG